MKFKHGDKVWYRGSLYIVEDAGNNIYQFYIIVDEFGWKKAVRQAKGDVEFKSEENKWIA